MQICRACRRHVKLVPCPFCGGTAVDAAAPLLGSGLARGQLLAGVALAAVAAGCTDQQTPSATSTSPDAAARAIAPAAGDAGRTKASSLAGGYGAPPAH